MGMLKTREKEQTTAWNPMRELQDMTSRVNQLFGSSLMNRLSLSPTLGEEMTSGIAEWAPSVNVSETDGEYKITAEIPAVEMKDVHVKVLNGMLSIEGERRRMKEEKGEHFHRVESFYGNFVRRFAIPEDANPDMIDAQMNNGMLEVHIPKQPSVKAKGAREIKIG